MFIDLILFNRVSLCEKCYWTINNFLLSDRSCTPVLIEQGICKAILSNHDKIKTKSPELLAELFWTLNYLLDFDEGCVFTIYQQIPYLVPRLASELEYEGDRLNESPVNRPVIRIIGNLLTIPSINNQ